MHLLQKAASFTLPGVDGRAHSLECLRGAKATIVVFSCNHCPYVVMTEDRLIAVCNDYKAQGVGMAVINSNDAAKYPEDSFEEMKKRSQEKRFPFPYLRDESQDIARAYGAAYTPHLFVLDAGLNFAYTGSVDDDNKYSARRPPTRHYLRDALDDLIAGRPVRLPETRAVGCTIKWK
ncbi:MAG: thioredoxin family protein [Elusimicrobia bacterium]|nr:thioredoxin family protein [Elusimicrobiota bacterium]